MHEAVVGDRTDYGRYCEWCCAIPSIPW